MLLSLFLPSPTSSIYLSPQVSSIIPVLNESVISTCLKKPTLDEDQLSNCRPISNLSFIHNYRTCSQIKCLLIFQWSSQSSSSICLYCVGPKLHFTETHPLYVRPVFRHCLLFMYYVLNLPIIPFFPCKM